MKQVTIAGMSCEHCVRAATQALEGLGLQDVKVDLATGTATFAESAVTEEAVVKALEEEDFTAESFS